jgi:hypothetical protein
VAGIGGDMTSPPASGPPAGPAEDECGWCPLCRLVAGWRAENPEALAKVLSAAAAFADAVRELFEPAPAEPSDAPAPNAPRVQHIRLDTEAAS